MKREWRRGRGEGEKIIISDLAQRQQTPPPPQQKNKKREKDKVTYELIRRQPQRLCKARARQGFLHGLNGDRHRRKGLCPSGIGNNDTCAPRRRRRLQAIMKNISIQERETGLLESGTYCCNGRGQAIGPYGLLQAVATPPLKLHPRRPRLPTRRRHLEGCWRVVLYRLG